MIGRLRDCVISASASGQVASGQGYSVSLFSKFPGRLFKRRAIKMALQGGGVQGEVDWIVAELRGMRVYVANDAGTIRVVLSDEELVP